MKREFITFSRRPVSYLPKMQSRRFPGLHRSGAASYKSDGGDNDDEGDEKKKLLSDIQKKVKSELESRGYQKAEDVQKIIDEHFKGIELDALRKYKSEKDELNTTIQAMAEKLDKLEKRAGKAGEDRPLTLRQHIANELRAAYEKNKEKLEQFKRGEIKNLQLELRAPATMLEGTHLGGSDYVPQPGYEPGVVGPARNQPFMQAISNFGTTTRPSVIITEKKNEEGEALFIGEGEVKPLVDFEIATTRIDAKKIADKIKVSTEMLDDIDFMAAEIENELRYLVDIKTSNELLSGDGTGDNLTGLDTYAGGFVLTTIETTNPNNADAIRAAIAQIRSLNFNANLAVLNPIDAANMELEKAEDGHYIIPPFKSADGTVISGVRAIEENGIPVGSLLVGDMSRFKVRMYKAFAISYGWVNDDFEKNLVTVIGEQRLMAWVASNETGAFVYDTFANIKAAITAA